MTFDITEDINQFVDEHLATLCGENKRETQWAESRTLKSKRFKKRVIVLCDYRILSIKKGKLGLSLNHSLCFLDLSEMVLIDGCVELRLRNRDDLDGIVIKNDKESLQKMVHYIRDCHRYFTHSFPDIKSFKITANPDHLLPLSEKVVGVADGFIPVYKALCNYQNSLASSEVCRLVERYAADNITDLDINKCPGMEGKGELGFSIEMVLLALRYNKYFQSVIVNGSAQKNLVVAFGDVLLTNTTLKKITISDTTEDQSFNTLGLAIVENQFNSIQVLDFSHTPIVQSTFPTFCEGLESLKHGLKYINFSHCDLHSRSVELLFQALWNNFEMSSHIEYLNLTSNKFEDIGSSTCGQWIYKIQSNNNLKRFYLGTCQLNLLYLGNYLQNLVGLKTLDLSDNKMERAEIQEIATILGKSNGLEMFDLSKCHLNNEQLLFLSTTITKNYKIKSLILNISFNNVGKNINSLVSTFQSYSVLKSLNISNNSLGYKGLSRLLDALRKNEHIQAIKLDNNFTGTINEGREFISEVKNFLDKKVELISLSLGGSPSCHIVGELMKPLLEYLEKENKTLEVLNISGNMLGDLMAANIANLLENNCTLKSLDVDRNMFSINAYQTIMLSLQNNRTLLNLTFPSVDFEKAILMLPTSKKCLLFSVMHKIQAIVEENGVWYVPQEHYYPTPTSSKNTLYPTNDIYYNIPLNQQQNQQNQQQQSSSKSTNSSIDSNNHQVEYFNNDYVNNKQQEKKKDLISTDLNDDNQREEGDRVPSPKQQQSPSSPANAAKEKLRSQTKLTPRSLVDSIDIVMATLEEAAL